MVEIYSQKTYFSKQKHRKNTTNNTTDLGSVWKYVIAIWFWDMKNKTQQKTTFNTWWDLRMPMYLIKQQKKDKSTIVIK